MTTIDFGSEGARPDDFPEEVDTLVLGTMRSPGTVVLSGHDRWKNWEVKKSRGQQGAATYLKPDSPGQFTATFSLADDDSTQGEGSDFVLWESFAALINGLTSGPKPKTLPIYHPDLARNGFTEVTSGGIGGFNYDGRGGVTVQVKFVEYLPPKPKPPKPADGGSGAVRQGVTTLDRNAAARARLEELREQVAQI